MFFPKAFLVAGGLASVSQAHMLLRIPAPYSSPALQNGPLAPDGSNFPCQSTGGAFTGTPTKMAKGSTQKMGFTGQAVHSGGSCQISITYDEAPNKQSSFKVIHSIQGGCPARNVNGNAGNDPAAAAVDEYEFTIPEGIPNGKATLAWSWLNKGGNREFYMNCAPIEISGAEGSQATLAALPDMLVANIAPGGTCATTEGIDIEFPNPGASVETNPGAKLGPPTGQCGATASTGNTTTTTGAAANAGAGAGAAASGVPSPAPRRRIRGRSFAA
ncbi:hypothetical protein C8A05DRAFT_17043 [Staphylotrichum tortipilum]|uniref:Lytic polysaccharide monooxygenase n=1 Tax=Staphylotrichum tortipilum TaxID=2831512 RepID=A0AAN6MIC2_9PEZI|nr:hypothetical protein C8A05DRAFT_17043 [Staphylotrichum longicolle]